MPQLTHSPDPQHLLAGAGTAAEQSARARQNADHANGGWVDAPPPIIPATGATAGIPGAFTPAGAQPPANLTAMAGIVASPTTAWTIGQHVIMGNTSHTYWNGTAWAAGDAP